MSFAQELKDFTGGLQAGWKLGKPSETESRIQYAKDEQARFDRENAKGQQMGEDNATPGAVGIHPTLAGTYTPSAPSFNAGGFDASGRGVGGGAGRAMRMPDGTGGDLDLAARVLAAEAGGEGPTGIQAAGHVIMNRAKLSGQSPAAIVMAPHQFEAYSNGTYKKYGPGHPAYDQAYNSLKSIGSGSVPDITGGATNYLNPDLQARLGRAQPSWANGSGTRIGNHVFYSYPQGFARPGRQMSMPAEASAGDGSPVRQVLPGYPDSAPAPQRFAEGGLVRAIPEDDYETWAPRPDNEVRPPRRPQALPVRDDVPLPPPRPQDERVAEGTPTPPARPDDLPRGYDPSTSKLRQVARQTGADDGREEVANAPHPPARPSDLTAKVAATLGIPWKDPPRPASEYASLPAEPDTGDRNDWEDGGPTPIPNDLSGKSPPLPPRRPTNLAAAPQGAPQAVTPRGKPAPVPPRRQQALDLSYSDLPPRPGAPQGAPDYTSSERAGTGGEAGSYWASVGANHVNDAVHAGLTYLSSAGAGASAPRQAIPTAGQPSAQQAQPLQPPPPQEVQAVDQALDPQKKLTPDERAMARLYGGYQYFRDKGDLQGAQRYAALMLLHSKSVIGHAGAIAQVALQHGDMQGAANAIAQGYSQLPDGKSVKVLSVGPDGVQYAIVDDRTGQQVDQRRAALNDMMAVATGMSNGSAWLDALEQGFTPQGKPGAARGQTPERIAQMARQANQRDRAMDQRDRALSQRDGAGGTGTRSRTKAPVEPEYDSDDVKTVDETLRGPDKKLTLPEQDHFDLRMVASNISRFNEMEPDQAVNVARSLLQGGFQPGENNTVTTQDGQVIRLNPQSLGALSRLKRRADELRNGAGAGGTKPPPYTSPAAERMAKADQSQREVTGRAQADQTQNVRAEKLARNKKILGPDWRDGMTLEQSDRAVRDKVLEESLANPVAPGSVRGSAIPLAPTMGR